MGDTCSIGFRELFMLAKGRTWTAEEERQFQAVDQPTRNQIVKALAAEAGNIRTEDRTGNDGLIYTAFWVDETTRCKSG